MAARRWQRVRHGAVAAAAVAVLGGLSGCQPAPRAPIGNVDAVEIRYSHGVLDVQVRGWAWDPDSTAPIPVHLYVDGRLHAAGPADEPRPDVAAAYPAAGGSHGFRASVGRLDWGPHQVCVYGINVGPEGPNALLGCADATVPTGLPWGELDTPTGTPPGTVTVTGFATDPDTSGPIQVHLYVDGQARQAGLADRFDPVRSPGEPPWGGNHGFAFAEVVGPGPHEVCVYAINAGGGHNPSLGCRTV